MVDCLFGGVRRVEKECRFFYVGAKGGVRCSGFVSKIGGNFIFRPGISMKSNRNSIIPMQGFQIKINGTMIVWKFCFYLGVVS